MSPDANPDAFLALLTQGLISDAQHDAARAHPETAALPPLPSPAHALAWMRVRGLVTEEEQNAALDKIGDDAPHVDDAADTAIDADDLIELAGQGITHEAIEVLFRDSLIDAETRDMALTETPVVGTVAASPVATLAWLATEGPLEKERFDALRTQVAAEPAFAMAAERTRIVNEAQALIEADEQAVKAWQARAQRSRRIGAWKFILAVAVIGGGLGWYLFAPASVPACDAASTRKTLDSLMRRVTMDVRMRHLDPNAGTVIETPSVGSMREVGYRKPERVRGCVAVMTRGDSKEPMAYTIGPTEPKSDEMVVRGADVAIVEARFGHLDSDGRPLYNAEPIGREAMEKAFREGAAPLSAARSASAMRMRPRTDSGLVRKDPNRSREIAEIEPTGPCRKLDDGAGHACPLVIEYNDSLLGALSGSDTSLPVTGEFTFVEDNGSWRVSDDFPKTFVRKVLEARLNSMGVTDAAMPQ
ncbi:hypothetical protein J2W35_000887 [Variovorax boronicumulans]|uniref:hypothetical protein n=1 Tax=Variovorax boronicumulans TaxID=436515 RepID=UPI0027818B3B|nr:hypothetical protein [Variovorax boronicumulans]MDQ0080557.1 hypothetical protein [Variovorax boronicumulans]